ncbi:MAG: nucleotidyltransferase domain-containing protein [Spirochaetales bacterium]
MNIPGLSELDLSDVNQAFLQVPQVEKAVLFGSRAKGTAKRGSDVDLALWGKALDRSALVDLSVLLNQEGCLPYQFDLVDFETVDNPALREHIERVGIVVYEKGMTK